MSFSAFFSQKSIPGFALFAGSALCYWAMSYCLERNQFLELSGLFAVLFFCYWRVMNYGAPHWRAWLAAAFAFRVLLLFSFPNLSDDIYRFIWDGRLLLAGENPYLHTPAEQLLRAKTIPGITHDLLERLNSPNYYSVYPPVLQLLFTISCLFSSGSLAGASIVMKLMIVVFEAGSALLITNLLERFKMDARLVLLYALNPLVISELSGNVHPEAFMIFFVLLAIYLMVKNRLLLSAIFLGLSIGTKLLPLIFLPLFIRRLGWGKGMLYCATAGTMALASYVPFFDMELAEKIASGIDLYFRKFEFNASVYYLLREAGYFLSGENAIRWTGPILASLAALTIVLITLKEKSPDWHSWFNTGLFVLSLYFFCSTTVHPWYLTTLVAFSVFGTFRFALLWTAMAVLSYAAYNAVPYRESVWLIALEYTMVFACLIYEVTPRISSNRLHHKTKWIRK